MDTVLVVDDSAESQKKLRDYLSEHGFHVCAASSILSARASIEEHRPSIIILDFMLHGEYGIEFLKYVRQSHPDIGLIVVSDRADVVDRIIGLEVGADDYIAKPFHLREVLARVKSVLRRSGGAAFPDSLIRGDIFCFEDWRIDTDRHKVISDHGEEVSLTSGEYKLLEVFVRHPHRVLSRDHLLEMMASRRWEPFDRSVDTRVRRLRAKIEEDPTQPRFILTIRGEGYLFAANVNRISRYDFTVEAR
ncbi:MAG: response regulator transcription factor [Sphingomonadales bacterium]|nr:response regulator transcription factor [Sphingomonadales bacterium]